jgi:FkbM family methyltransferase
LLSKIKAYVPAPIKVFIKKIWQRIRPPRVKLTKFVASGCIFEITSRTEHNRVTGYGKEADSIQRVLSEIKTSDVFYDIGSCVGIYALHAAYYGGVVIAFEPDPGYRKRLKRNIKINRLKKRIQVIDWAVSDRSGIITLYTDGVEGNSPSLSLVGDRGAVSVKTNTIDNAVASKQIPYPDIVKMDIEGAEMLALQGMKKLLDSEKAPRFLFIEFHPEFLSSFNSSVEECEMFIESHGYTKVDVKQRLDQLHYFYKKAAR